MKFIKLFTKALPRFIYYLLRTFSIVKANMIIYNIWYLKHNMIKLIMENFSVSQYLIISITIKLLRVNSEIHPWLLFKDRVLNINNTKMKTIHISEPLKYHEKICISIIIPALSKIVHLYTQSIVSHTHILMGK